VSTDLFFDFNDVYETDKPAAFNRFVGLPLGERRSRVKPLLTDQNALPNHVNLTFFASDLYHIPFEIAALVPYIDKNERRSNETWNPSRIH